MDQTQQPQVYAPLKRSTRERKFTISDDYIVHLLGQEIKSETECQKTVQSISIKLCKFQILSNGLKSRMMSTILCKTIKFGKLSHYRIVRKP